MFLKEKKKPIKDESNKIDISATIVLYNEKLNVLSKTVNDFLNTEISKKLFLIDNSPEKIFKNQFDHPDVEYIFNGSNLGFARAHNLVLNRIKEVSKYHLVLNPDVEFDSYIVNNLINELNKHSNVAMIAPKVVFPNGNFQYTCRKYPTPLELFSRRFKIFKSYQEKMEYRNVDLSTPFCPEFIHGCFYMFKTEDFVRMKGFDERYFLYMEDVDICRKIDQLGKKKLYYPKVQITHVLKKESSKNFRLFFTHLNSSLKYFKKWGF